MTSAPSEPAAASHPGLPMPRRFAAIAAISFGTALFVVDGNIANVALPTIADSLGTSSGSVVGVVTLYQLVLVMGLLPFSNLGDRIGHRRLYQIGQVIFMIASASALFATSLPGLLVVRAAQATGAGMALSVSAAMLREIYPSSKLGSGLGINSIIIASSNALAPTLGGFLVANAGWRWVFVAAVPFAALSLVIGRSLPDPEEGAQGFDLVGGIWSAATFGLVIGGLELAAHATLVPGIAMTLAGLVTGFLLVRRERGRSRPVLPVDLLGTRVIGLSILAAVIAFMASAALVVVLPFRLEQGLGYTPDQVGLLILPFPLTLLFVAPAAGWLSDTVKPSILGFIGLALALVGLVAIGFLPSDAHWPGIAWRLVICAAGFGLFFAPNSRVIIGSAPRHRSAPAGGMLSTSRLLGQTLGASMVGIELAANLGLGPAPMLIAAGFIVIAIVINFVRFRTT